MKNIKKMKNGRINERNSGSWSKNSTPKIRNNKIQNEVVLNEIEKKALISLDKINSLLKSDAGGYYSYLPFDLSDELINQWFENGIISKGLKKSKYDFMPDKEICKLEKKADLLLTKGILEKFYPKILQA